MRIITAPRFDGRPILAAILFERTMDGQAEGQSIPAYLRNRGIVPFLKIDQGLEPEADGVRLMKPMAGLSDLLERARSLGVFGTKMRSVVNRADPVGISAVVDQQFELAEQVAAAGLMPILEPEVSSAAPDRATAESHLMAEITKRLDALSGDRQVMLKLTIPEQPDGYAPLVGHHRVARLLALSGGLSRGVACDRLAQNHGLIASFSRALLADLDYHMDDATFNRTLGGAIEQIYTASTVKRWR
ncbi:class I fructose-bisphosphate aldolase [Sphingomonas endolithica]|uniref:class I fructose-bisphosphate aldolase n=1 Tax=Sphingomonas endolithica TaxID=2972485 RepID=UPI0028A1BCCA|nr:class I fructose-bisphosphate aldolase [Sphingomonas sp. ZFBP2030]